MITVLSLERSNFLRKKLIFFERVYPFQWYSTCISMKCYPNFKFLLFYRAVGEMIQTRNTLLVLPCYPMYAMIFFNVACHFVFLCFEGDIKEGNESKISCLRWFIVRFEKYDIAFWYCQWFCADCWHSLGCCEFNVAKSSVRRYLSQFCHT